MNLNILLKNNHNLISVLRFGIIGIVATITHIVIVAFILAFNLMPIFTANFTAFLTAFCVSFIGNYKWTFKSHNNLKRSLGRYFLIASLGFIVNNIILFILIYEKILPPLYAAIISACFIPIVTFLLSKYWAFSIVNCNQNAKNIEKIDI